MWPVDNSGSAPVNRWTTPVAAAVLAGLATIILASIAGLSTNRMNILFAGIAALVCLVFLVHWFRARPRLSADEAGLTVRGTLHTYRWDHGQLRVLLRRTRRLGREGVLLELDGIDTSGEQRLVLLGRFDLGADPADVLDRLNELRGAQAQ